MRGNRCSNASAMTNVRRAHLRPAIYTMPADRKAGALWPPALRERERERATSTPGVRSALQSQYSRRTVPVSTPSLHTAKRLLTRCRRLHHDHPIPDRCARNLQPLQPTLEACAPVPLPHSLGCPRKWHEDRTQDAASHKQGGCDVGRQVQYVWPPRKDPATIYQLEGRLVRLPLHMVDM
jgi:hypothetical protein